VRPQGAGGRTGLAASEQLERGNCGREGRGSGQGRTVNRVTKGLQKTGLEEKVKSGWMKWPARQQRMGANPCHLLPHPCLY
jgi:hypothetical protein